MRLKSDENQTFYVYKEIFKHLPNPPSEGALVVVAVFPKLNPPRPVEAVDPAAPVCPNENPVAADEVGWVAAKPPNPAVLVVAGVAVTES